MVMLQTGFATYIYKFLVLVSIALVSVIRGQAQTPIAPTASLETPAQAALSAGFRTAVTLPPEKQQPVQIPKFEKPPVIDGVLNEEVWKKAAVLKDFYQVRPGDNITPSQPTEVMIGYDSKFLYVAFRAHGEASKVRATVAKRDAVQDDDHVRLYLDTFNDQRRAYIFIFNPLGVQQDGIYTEGVGEDYTIDVVMESKGVVTEQGYTVEAAIPFKSLRYESGTKRPWGIHIQRRIKNINNELTSWMPISREKSGFLNQEGHIAGLEEIPAERTLEIIPSLTISETGNRVRTIPRSVVDANPGLIDPGRFVNQPLHFDPGLTAKMGITSNITLDLAINPDFAQVEADQLVITANQRSQSFIRRNARSFSKARKSF